MLNFEYSLDYEAFKIKYKLIRRFRYFINHIYFLRNRNYKQKNQDQAPPNPIRK